MRWCRRLTRTIPALAAILFVATAWEEGDPDPVIYNEGIPPGPPGPCIDKMSNGDPCVRDVLGYPIDIYRDDWNDHDREVFWNTLFRDQGKQKTVPGFTSIGFKKMKMPFQMYLKLLEYYESVPDVREPHSVGSINNVDPDSLEAKRMQEKNPGMKAATCHHRPLEGPVLDMIMEYMLPALEEWIGGQIRLEYTSIYGMRVYTNGSMLMNHCDRTETHAVSAILNIKQEGMRKPWPVSIMDHDGVTQEIDMDAGEMILYESARLAHGRPRPLDGERYTNAFVHTRPQVIEGLQSDWQLDVAGSNARQIAHETVRRQQHEYYNKMMSHGGHGGEL